MSKRIKKSEKKAYLYVISYLFYEIQVSIQVNQDIVINLYLFTRNRPANI